MAAGEEVPGADAELETALRELIEASGALRAAADAGRTEEVLTLVDEREALVSALARSAPRLPSSVEACRELFERLRDEDRATLERLEAWKRETGRALHALAGGRAALAGYARTAGSEPPLVDREL